MGPSFRPSLFPGRNGPGNWLRPLNRGQHASSEKFPASFSVRPAFTPTAEHLLPSPAWRNVIRWRCLTAMARPGFRWGPLGLSLPLFFPVLSPPAVSFTEAATYGGPVPGTSPTGAAPGPLGGPTRFSFSSQSPGDESFFPVTERGGATGYSLRWEMWVGSSPEGMRRKRPVAKKNPPRKKGLQKERTNYPLESPSFNTTTESGNSLSLYFTNCITYTTHRP